MKKILIGSFSMVVLSLALIATPVFAVGTNGSFETGITEVSPGFNTLTSPDSTSIIDWTVDSGSVDYIGTYWPASNGVRSIDLNGLVAGSISQILPTVIGATYNVNFDLSGNPENQVATQYTSPNNKVVIVSATGATFQDFNYDTSVKGNSLSNMMWEGKSYSFVATTTSTTLIFTSQIPGAFGPAIDNVVIGEILPVPTTPVYIGSNSCSAGKTPILLSGLTQTINSQGTSPISVILPTVGEYLFEATGDYGYGGDPANNTINRADAGYATGDNWYTTLDSILGIAAGATYRGVTSLVSDMGTGTMGIVNWGNYDPAHNYKFSYTPTSTSVQFIISDWYDSWYAGGVNNNQGGVWDNAGSLTLNVYECIVQPTTGTISGMKYNDLDRDGIKDENEPGLQGWAIRLILDNDLTDEDTVVATATTDSDGNYSFINVAPGTYEVRETHQKGWKRMSKNPKDIVITAGSDITGVNFGNAVKQKGEKEDTDKDDNCDEQQGHYEGNHNGSDYENDQNNGEHENDKPKNDKPNNDKPENDRGNKGDRGERD